MTRKRVNGRFAKEAVEEKLDPAAVGPSAVGPARPRNCRMYALKRMTEAMPAIVSVLVKKAKAGSVAHAKALAELSGLPKPGTVVQKAVKRAGAELRGAVAGGAWEE